MTALLNVAADVNAQDRDGATALHVAAEKSGTGAVAALLDAGADVNAQDSNGAASLRVLLSDGSVRAAVALAIARLTRPIEERPGIRFVGAGSSGGVVSKRGGSVRRGGL